MTYVDSAVLDFTERICRRSQTWTGRTNVWLAFHLTNLSIVLYFVGLFCGGVFFMLPRTVFRTSIEGAEAEAYRRVAKGLRNPRRLRDTQLRIAFLTLSVLLSYPLWLAYIRLHV